MKQNPRKQPEKKINAWSAVKHTFLSYKMSKTGGRTLHVEASWLHGALLWNGQQASQKVVSQQGGHNGCWGGCCYQLPGNSALPNLLPKSTPGQVGTWWWVAAFSNSYSLWWQCLSHPCALLKAFQQPCQSEQKAPNHSFRMDVYL